MQGFGSGSALDPHFWRPWIGIRIRISNVDPDPDPDPRLITQLEIQGGKYKINHFFTFSKRKHELFKNIYDFFHICKKA